MKHERRVKRGLKQYKKKFSISDTAVAAAAKSFFYVGKIQLNSI